MQDENLERWQELCQEAAGENDSEKLLQLTNEINSLLDAKEQQRLKSTTANGKSHGSAA